MAHGVSGDCKVLSLNRPSKIKQHGIDNNKSWLNTCSQVIKLLLLKFQHDKLYHTSAKLDVTSLGKLLEHSTSYGARNSPFVT